MFNKVNQFEFNTIFSSNDEKTIFITPIENGNDVKYTISYDCPITFAHQVKEDKILVCSQDLSVQIWSLKENNFITKSYSPVEIPLLNYIPPPGYSIQDFEFTFIEDYNDIKEYYYFEFVIEFVIEFDNYILLSSRQTSFTFDLNTFTFIKGSHESMMPQYTAVINKKSFCFILDSFVYIFSIPQLKEENKFEVQEVNTSENHLIEFCKELSYLLISTSIFLHIYNLKGEKITKINEFSRICSFLAQGYF